LAAQEQPELALVADQRRATLALGAVGVERRGLTDR
jgi:hypothetical protein